MSRRDLNSRVEHSKGASQADFAKYAAAVLLVVAGVFAFYWFEAQLATVVRSVIVALCIVGADARIWRRLGVHDTGIHAVQQGIDLVL